MQPNESQVLLFQSGAMRKLLLGGISESTLQRWLSDPALDFPRPFKIGQRRFWNRETVIAWVKSREVAA